MSTTRPCGPAATQPLFTGGYTTPNHSVGHSPVQDRKDARNASETLNSADFKATILANPIELVDFWAPWCGPCRAFAPVFERSAKNHTDIVHAKVDTDAQRELAAIVGIRSVPTIMAFREGILVCSRPGAMPPAVLEDLIGQIKGLDMARVRTRIAERKAATKV